MTGRICAGVALVAICASACASSRAGVQPPGQAVPMGRVYSSDRLRQALLTDLPGFSRVGEPDSGAYGSLKAIENFNRFQQQVTLDKPQCSNLSKSFAASAEALSAPAAIATFAKAGGETATETLMAISDETAARQVALRVADNCRTFRAEVGGQWSDHQVVEGSRNRIGAGSRAVGVETTSGGTRVKTWYVVLRSHGYLATITLYGPDVTQGEADQAAHAAYDVAEHKLR